MGQPKPYLFGDSVRNFRVVMSVIFRHYGLMGKLSAMKKLLLQTLTGTILAMGLIPITWLFFGPIAGFHHMIGCGITFYLTLDGESPQPGSYMWGEYQVRFFWGRFAVALLLWSISVFILFKFVRIVVRFFTETEQTSAAPKP